ncbi:hypothetical protein KJ780_04890 [Candidatus Micrarchaeota archaeon]|nr:hypothetical protein [Candidatus Micrarchaeota archaeon]
MMEYLPYAFLAVMFAFLISALLIMFSRLFDFKLLEQSAKSEMVFAVSSLILVLLLAGIVNDGQTVMKNIVSDMYVYSYKDVAYPSYTTVDALGRESIVQLTPDKIRDPSISLVEVAILYMKSVLRCAEGVAQVLYVVSAPAYIMSSLSQDVWMAFPISGWAMGGVAQTFENILNQIYFLEVVFRVEIYILKFLDVTAIPIFLPAGIILRAFPPTRGAGAYILALTIGLYFVFPFAYITAVLSSPYPQICGTSHMPPMPDQYGITEVGFFTGLKMWYRAFEDIISGLWSDSGGTINAMLTNLCFVPFLALAITLTFVQGATGLFGANISEIGRGLVKLI